MGEILKNIFADFIVVAVGCGFFGIGSGEIKTLFSCREQIKGVCDTKYTSVNLAHYYLRFCYDYQGKTYRVRALDDYNAKNYNFIVGEEYPIYINPEKPRIMRCTKKRIYLRDIILIWLGVVIMCGGIIMLSEYMWTIL